MKQRAFTITELLIGVTIMSILAGVMTLNSSTIGRQTAKREAERVAACIQNQMRIADKLNKVVYFEITADEIKVSKDTVLNASNGCSLSYMSGLPLYLAYPKDSFERIYTEALNNKTFQPIVQYSSVTVGIGKGEYTLTVHGQDGQTCDVIIGR